jgi:hypothetical protein
LYSLRFESSDVSSIAPTIEHCEPSEPRPADA